MTAEEMLARNAGGLLRNEKKPSPLDPLGPTCKRKSKEGKKLASLKEGHHEKQRPTPTHYSLRPLRLHPHNLFT